MSIYYSETNSNFDNFDFDTKSKSLYFFSTNANVVLTGDDRRGRFGWKIIVLDFNCDGYNDLIVAAPTNGYSDHIPDIPKYTNYGSVYIYLGTKNGINSDDNYDISITTSQNLTHLGFGGLYAIDINNDGFKDLLIASPLSSNNITADGDTLSCMQCGNVLVFYSSKDRSSAAAVGDSYNNEVTLDTFNDCDIAIFAPISDVSIYNGQTQFTLFGSHVDYDNDLNLLFIGAPGVRNLENNVTLGCIYAYNIDCTHDDSDYDDGTDCVVTQKWGLVGDVKNSGFGRSFAVGSPYNDSESISQNVLLVVGLPSETNKEIYKHDVSGSVRIYDVNTINSYLTQSGHQQDHNNYNAGAQNVNILGNIAIGNSSSNGILSIFYCEQRFS